MTPKPNIENAPGLTWRYLPREGWEARWRAQPNAIAKGFPIKGQRIWTGEAPSHLQCLQIVDRCNALQAEMQVFMRGGLPKAGVQGVLASVIQLYRTDEHSNFARLRYETRRTYDKHLTHIIADYGNTSLADLKARTFLDWHKTWTQKNGPATARFRIQVLRAVMTYGLRLLDDEGMQDECERASHVLSKLAFPTLAARVEALTATQATAIRELARAGKYPSIALAQAIQFECSFRQKDVIGEWEPDGDFKTWDRGVKWEEIDSKFLLVHRTSKKQKVIAWPLLKCPMVVEELCAAVECKPAELRRDMFPQSGPVIVCELRGLPYHAVEYRRLWRKTARVAGVPDSVFNMDSRAGATTEAQQAGVPLKERQIGLTHASGDQTLVYSRDALEINTRSLEARAAYRNAGKLSQSASVGVGLAKGTVRVPRKTR